MKIRILVGESRPQIRHLPHQRSRLFPFWQLFFLVNIGDYNGFELSEILKDFGLEFRGSKIRFLTSKYSNIRIAQSNSREFFLFQILISLCCALLL